MFRNHPQFGALKQLVQTNPSLLPRVLQELAQSNPQLMQLIATHQQEFVQLMQEPLQGGASPQQGASQQQQQGGSPGT